MPEILVTVAAGAFNFGKTEVPKIGAGFIAKAVINRIIQTAVFAYQLYYLPPLINSLRKFATEIQPVSANSAHAASTAAKAMEANLAAGSVLTSLSLITPAFPLVQFTIGGFRLAATAINVYDVYRLVHNGINISTPNASIGVSAQLGITRILRNLATFNIDPAGDVDKATALVRAIKAHNVTAASLAFAGLWSNAEQYLDSVSAHGSLTSAGGQVSQIGHISVEFP